MSDDKTFDFLAKHRDAPAVGQPFTTVTTFVTVLGQCNCSEKPTPLLAVGLGAIARCKLCGKGYQILSFKMDLRTDKLPTLTVNIVLDPEPAKLVTG